MNIDFQNPEYLNLIKSIRRKRKCVMAVMVISILACLPTDISFGDTVIIDKAFSPWISVLLVLLCLFLGIVAYAAVSIPLQTAMDKDCDPEKHLVLNAALTSKTGIDNVYATDYLYLGYFTEALEYAMRMTSNANPQVSVIGWFNKARCAFMLETTFVKGKVCMFTIS
ncbi:MAG: hypothetical protein IJB65_06265 [Clostridia bacterium]|nr:hypothetical protein [Clostridia bacterium]